MDASEIGVVFDCDGTLLDSMGVWHGLQNELAERAGDTLTADDVAALAPMSIPECGAFFHEKFGLGESDHEVVGMIDEYMLDFYRHRAEARPGALVFVQGLAQAGAHLTVASSSPKPYLMAGIERCGFARISSACCRSRTCIPRSASPTCGTAPVRSWERPSS